MTDIIGCTRDTRQFWDYYLTTQYSFREWTSQSAHAKPLFFYMVYINCTYLFRNGGWTLIWLHGYTSPLNFSILGPTLVKSLTLDVEIVSRLPPIAQKIQRKWQSQLFLRTCLYSSLGGEMGLVWGILILWRQNFPIPIRLCNILLISLSLADNWQSIFHISLFIFCWQRLTPFRFLWKPCDPKNPPPLPPGDKKGQFPQQGTLNPHVTYIH